MAAADGKRHLRGPEEAPAHQNKGQRTGLNYFSDIKAGDYVVHDVQGIGRYMGVETIEVNGVHRDYLQLQYAGGDKLHVPVEQVGLLHKYVGNEGTPPKLSNMGRKDWQKATRKARRPSPSWPRNCFGSTPSGRSPRAMPLPRIPTGRKNSRTASPLRKPRTS